MAIPTLSLDADTTSRLTRALGDPSVRPQDALQEAQSYQSQKNTAPSLNLGVPTSPKPSEGILGHIKDALLGKDSIVNLPTLGGTGGGLGGAAAGAAAGSLFGPIGTVIGGLGGGLIGAFGGGAAGEAGREALSGEDLNKDTIVHQGLVNGAYDLAGGVAGKVVGAGVKTAANLLGKEGENLAIKGLGTTDNALYNYAQKHGEDAKSTLLRNNLAGAGPEQITNHIDQLQGQFDNLINQSGISVSKSDLHKNMLDQVMPLLHSTDPQDHTIAEKILQNFENIDAKFGDTVDISDLNKLRQGYDGKVNYSMLAQDPEQFGPKKVIADTLRKTVQEAADSAGAATTAGGLKDTGIELSKLYDLQKLAEKGSYKGSARPPAGLLESLGAIAGSGVAGLPGLIGGGFLTKMINDPKKLAFLSKLSTSLGKGVDSVSKLGTGPLGQTAGAYVPQAVGAALTSGPSQDNGIPVSPNTDSPALSGNQTEQPMMTRAQYQHLLAQDAATTGGRYSGLITNVFQSQNPDQVQGLDTAANALGTLTDLYQTAGGAQGGIKGRLKGAIGDLSLGLGEQDVKSYNDQASSLGQEIISQLYGSGGTAEDRDKILNNIPKITDSPTVAKSKILTLHSVLKGRLNANFNASPTDISTQLSGPSLNLNQ